jgi:hypothetical protein
LHTKRWTWATLFRRLPGIKCIDLIWDFVVISLVSLRFKQSDFAIVAGLLQPACDCGAQNAVASFCN